MSSSRHLFLLSNCADRRHHLLDKNAESQAHKPPADTGGTSFRPRLRPPPSTKLDGYRFGQLLFNRILHCSLVTDVSDRRENQEGCLLASSCSIAGGSRLVTSRKNISLQLQRKGKPWHEVQLIRKLDFSLINRLSCRSLSPDWSVFPTLLCTHCSFSGRPSSVLKTRETSSSCYSVSLRS